MFGFLLFKSFYGFFMFLLSLCFLRAAPEGDMKNGATEELRSPPTEISEQATCQLLVEKSQAEPNIGNYASYHW